MPEYGLDRSQDRSFSVREFRAFDGHDAWTGQPNHGRRLVRRRFEVGARSSGQIHGGSRRQTVRDSIGG